MNQTFRVQPTLAQQWTSRLDTWHGQSPKKHPTLNAYLSAETYAAGYYMNKPKFMVSLLKEWFGENATAENDYCYDLLPETFLEAQR